MIKNYTCVLMAMMAIFFAGVSSAQISRHPLAFYGAAPNFYKDYVGMKLQVTAPTSISRDYEYTTSNDGSGGATTWGGFLTTPLVNVPVIMGVGSDSFACASLPAGSMTGKIALIWRGTCEFSAKAYEAQLAGAVAVVIVNSIPGEGPVGMAAGAMGSFVTIPVYMVGNLDGISISATYHTTPAGTVKMSITPWSKGLNNDLGFVPGGAAMWHNSAIPSFQIPAPEPSPMAYKGLDGAFIANFGNLSANNVKLATTLKFTPTGGSPATVHTSTVTMSPTTFPTSDSIWALFSNEYNLPGVTTTGRYDLTYTIQSAATDDFPGDNTTTHSFYATDSIFSKGRYDIVNGHPLATVWRSSSNPAYLWGVPYFVKHGSCVAFKDIQFSASTGAGPIISGSGMQVFHIYQWLPASIGDSTMEPGELTEIGSTTYTYTSADSSFEYFTTDPVTDLFGNPLQMTDSTWYLVAVEADPNIFIGCDGLVSGYPRSYGRRHVSNYTELYNPLFPGDNASLPSFPTSPFFSYFGGGGVNGNPFNVDSIFYSPQRELLPALALRVTPYQTPIGNIVSPAGMCVGDTIGIMMTDTTTAGAWTTSGSGISVFAGTNPAIAAMVGVAAGSTTISYSVSGSCGTTVATTTVTVTSTDAGTISGPSSVCIGSAITLSDAAAGGTWGADNANVSLSGGVVVTGVTAGTSTVSYNVFGACGLAAATQVVTVNALPVPAIAVSGGTLTTGTYATYQWYVGTTTPISGATNATFEALTNGLYQVTVTDANGCTGSSAVNVNTVGVDNLYNTGNISVYPNPTKSVLNIVGADNVSVKMYNAVGQTVKEVSKANSIRVADLAAGIYFVKVFNEQGEVIYYNKIVKE